MKKKLFTLLLLLATWVCGISAQTNKSFSETTVFYTTIENCQQAYADGWAHGGKNAGTFSPKDAQTVAINPETDEEFSSSTKLAGIVIKQSNAVKSIVVYVKGIAEVKAYTRNTNSTELRTLSMEITPVGDTSVVKTNDNAGNATIITSSEALDVTKEYKIQIFATGDLHLYALKFIVPSGPSDNATLSSIKIGEEEATLNGTTYSYELPASHEGETASVIITPASDKALVTVSTDATPNTTAGVYTATVAIGTPVTVSVKAEAGNTSEYTLSLTKAVTKSSDTSLSALTVDGQAATLVEGETGKYTFDIPYAYDGALEIVATPTDNLPIVSDITTPTVAAGASVDVKFTVTAEDQSTQDYTLTITRAAASTECTLKSFSINGFAGTVNETAKTVEVKVVEDYDFSHTPVMNISALATAAWDKETMKVKVTAEDGVAATEYMVSPAAENIQPFAASAYPYELSFAAATYTEYVEWIYGAPYNANQKDPTNAEVVGCYELASESAEGNIAKGTHALNVYLAKCGTLTLKVGATGGRNLVATVNGNQCGSLTIGGDNTKTYCDLVCKVDSDESVVVTVTATGSNGGTRVYGMNVTEPIGLCIGSQAADGMSIYATDGTLYISSTETKTINIYGIDGRLVKTVELNEGMNTIDGLVAGIYLVNNQKVVINK